VFTGIVKVKLSSELKWEGKDISVIELDFGKVNGAMIKRCESATFSNGNGSAMFRPASSEYCSRLASEISGVPLRAIEKLPFYDFEKTWQTVAAFILHKDPQAFYEQFTDGDEDAVFTPPAEKPEETKPEKTETSTKTK